MFPLYNNYPFWFYIPYVSIVKPNIVVSGLKIRYYDIIQEIGGTTMQKQTDSIFIPNGQQKKDVNQTIYKEQKKITITKSETSNKIESNQTTYWEKR